jgi:hypothetical protein
MFYLEKLGVRWDRLFSRYSNESSFHVQTIVSLLSFESSQIPFELQYAIEHLPNGAEMVKRFLSEGKGIAILSLPRVPRVLREAAVRIAKTQSSTVDPWLARLIFHETMPIVDSTSLDEARRIGTDPYADARKILAHRVGMIRFSLFDLHGKGVMQADIERMDELNHAIEPLSASYLYHRLNEDLPNRPIRFISVLLRIACLSLILTWTLSVSFVFSFFISALADGVARKIGALITLRHSGYTKRQIKKEAFPYLVPLTIGMIYSICSYSLFVSDRGAFAGFMFGLAVASFPIFSAAFRFFSMRNIYRKLERDGKLFQDMRRSPTAYAAYELKRDPSEWGLFIGSIVAPFFCAWIFYQTKDITSISIFTLVVCSMLDVFFAILWRYGLRVTDRMRFISKIMLAK